MVGRCRDYTNLTEFDDILNLFVTLPTPAGEPRGTVGAVRSPLVLLFQRRPERIITHASSQPYAEVLNAKEARWHAAAPADFVLPRCPDTAASAAAGMENVLRGALVSLSAAAPVSADVRTFCNDNMLAVTAPVTVASRQGAHARVRQWAAERRQRQRDVRRAGR